MYNSSTYRRPQAPADAASEKYRKQVQQLQELFPEWSNEGESRVARAYDHKF
jgi:hypothetical protein